MGAYMESIRALQFSILFCVWLAVMEMLFDTQAAAARPARIINLGKLGSPLIFLVRWGLHLTGRVRRIGKARRSCSREQTQEHLEIS